MCKRNESLHIKREFIVNIESEYSCFKSSILLKTPEEIYDSCNIIRFYECVHEYFQYNKNPDSQFINHMYYNKNIIAELKRIYDKYEYLMIDT